MLMVKKILESVKVSPQGDEFNSRWQRHRIGPPESATLKGSNSCFTPSA